MKRRVLAATVVAAAAAAPASASAAKIEITGSTPTITYTARGGEVNALRMSGTVGGGPDLRMAFFEYSAPLFAGRGCATGFPTVCGEVSGAFPVDASLGDKNDVAYLNSFTSELQLDAGPGDDDVLAGGVNATGDGGSDDDTVIVAASGLATGNGGPGRDRVTGGLGAVAAILTGGLSGDLLVPDGSLFDRATGGPGNDRIVSYTGSDVTLSGQAGSDVLVTPTGRSSTRRVLDGGSGSDVVVTHLGAATVDGGTGSDVIDVRGGAETAPDTVTCDAGSDVVWADAGDAVAADCETVLRDGTPPVFRKAQTADAAAQALLAHRPDPAAANH